MVEDRVTDGKRIAQLLSSELAGRESGPLAAVAVVDADPDAEPHPEGTVAYAVARDGDRFGQVLLYPDRADLQLALDTDQVVAAVRGPDLRVAGDVEGQSTAGETDNEVTLRVESGAAVKRAVDALVAGLEPD